MRAPEGNGCAERFIRTLKEDLLWVRIFDLAEDARPALLAFKDTYNATRVIGRLEHRTPDAVRRHLLSPAALAAQDRDRCLTIQGRHTGQHSPDPPTKSKKRPPRRAASFICPDG